VNACDAVVEALSQRRALSDEERTHLPTCPPCAALVAADSAPVPTARELAPGSELIEAMKDLRPVTPFDARKRAVVPLLWLLGITVVTLLRGLRGDVDRWSAWHLAALCLAWMGAAAAAWWALLARGKAGVGQPAGVRWMVVGLGCVWFEVLSLTGVDASVSHEGEMWWRANTGCLLHGVLYALVSAPALWWAARKSAPASPETAGAVAGLAAAYVGVLVLQMKCGLAEPMHVLGAHGLVLVVGAGLGLVGARRWLSP
jgi:hypothetical protein